MSEDNHRKYSLEFALNTPWKNVDDLLVNAKKIDQYLSGTKNVCVVDIPDSMTEEDAKKLVNDALARRVNKTDKAPMSVPLQSVKL